MKIFIQVYIRLLFCIFLYIPLGNAFCYVREDDYLSRNISLIGGNKPLIKHESQSINRLCISENSTDSFIFNVLAYGAKGDGITNDAKAFQVAWDAACKTTGGMMLVPSGFTFLLQPVNFEGSYCQPNIVVQMDGKIVAPSIKSNWVTNNYQWILFKRVEKGITIKGKGIFDGRGMSWWDVDSMFRPHAVTIMNSTNVTVTGITIENSPRMHIFLEDSQYVQIYNFTVLSPADSPNTDGIHLSLSQHVDIHNTTISCGDDCVSIQSGCSNVQIYNVNCGPGHGYSIGGLGPDNQEAHVSDIAVFNSTANDSMTGVRIKTWPGGYGSVHDIVFSNITMSNVGTPIVIDQYYCGGARICNVSDTNAVAVSNVSYTSIKGTYSYKSISLECSDFVPCRNLTFAAVEILPTPERGGVAQPSCLFAYGKVLTHTTPSLQGCLLPEEAPPPSLLMADWLPSDEAPMPAPPPQTHGYCF